MNKANLKLVAIIAATVAGIAFLQRNVMAVPVVGQYLPK